MKIVYDLISKSLETTSKNVKKSPRQCLNDVETYINNFEKTYIKKNQSDNYNYSIPVVFRESLTFNTDSEFNAYVKCQLSIAFNWFHFLVAEINQDIKRLTNTRLIMFGEYIRDFLFDITPFIEHIEQKKNPCFQFLNGDKSYNQHTVFIYKDSRSAYWNSCNKYRAVSHRGNLSASCYFLRQSLEVKFRRILGLIDITDNNHNSAKIRHDFFPEFIKNNIEHFELNQIAIPNLTKIYKWTNSTIHTSAMPYIWEQWFALNYCDNFFFPEPLKPGKGWSIHSSVIITKLDELLVKLYENVSKEYGNGKIWCFDMKKPEAIIRNA